MKVKSILFIVAFLGAILFVSCTPENIEDAQTDQQVDATKIQPPNNG
jgi:hypothetical protein